MTNDSNNQHQNSFSRTIVFEEEDFYTDDIKKYIVSSLEEPPRDASFIKEATLARAFIEQNGNGPSSFYQLMDKVQSLGINALLDKLNSPEPPPLSTTDVEKIVRRVLAEEQATFNETRTDSSTAENTFLPKEPTANSVKSSPLPSRSGERRRPSNKLLEL